MFKIKNIVVLFTVLAALGLSGDVWGMNEKEETDNVNVVFGLKSTNNAIYLYVLNSGNTSGAIKHESISVNNGSYIYYTKTLELDDTAGWTSIGEITVNNWDRYDIKKTDYKTALNNQQLSNKIEQGLKRPFLMEGLMQCLVTEEADPIVILKIEKEEQQTATHRVIFVLAKKAENPVLRTSAPVQTDVVEFKTAKQFFPIDAEEKTMKNFYRYDHSAPEGFVWIKVATYCASKEYIHFDCIRDKIRGPKFIKKIGEFIGAVVKKRTVATNIEKYEEVKDNNTNNNEIARKQQQLRVATIISRSLSVLSGLFWGTIWSYCDMLPINKKHRTVAKMGTNVANFITAKLCVNKNSKKTDENWVLGLATVSMFVAKCCGKQVVDATCTMVKNYFDKKVVKNINF